MNRKRRQSDWRELWIIADDMVIRTGEAVADAMARDADYQETILFMRDVTRLMFKRWLAENVLGTSQEEKDEEE